MPDKVIIDQVPCRVCMCVFLAQCAYPAIVAASMCFFPPSCDCKKQTLHLTSFDFIYAEMGGCQDTESENDNSPSNEEGRHRGGVWRGGGAQFCGYRGREAQGGPASV